MRSAANVRVTENHISIISLVRIRIAPHTYLWCLSWGDNTNCAGWRLNFLSRLFVFNSRMCPLTCINNIRLVLRVVFSLSLANTFETAHKNMNRTISVSNERKTGWMRCRRVYVEKIITLKIGVIQWSRNVDQRSVTVAYADSCSETLKIALRQNRSRTCRKYA